MKINEVISESLDEAGTGLGRNQAAVNLGYNIAKAANKYTPNAVSKGLGFAGKALGAAGSVLPQSVKDRLAKSPEVAKNITQGVNAWGQQVKRLQAAGRITRDTPVPDYVNLFVDFVNSVSRIPKPQLADVSNLLTNRLTANPKDNAAIRDAMSMVVAKGLANANQNDNEMLKKVSDIYSGLRQDYPAAFKNMQAASINAVKKSIRDYVTANPQATPAFAVDQIGNNLTNILNPASGTVTPQPGDTVEYAGETYKWSNNAWFGPDNKPLGGDDAVEANAEFARKKAGQ